MGNSLGNVKFNALGNNVASLGGSSIAANVSAKPVAQNDSSTLSVAYQQLLTQTNAQSSLSHLLANQAMGLNNSSTAPNNTNMTSLGGMSNANFVANTPQSSPMLTSLLNNQQTLLQSPPQVSTGDQNNNQINVLQQLINQQMQQNNVSVNLYRKQAFIEP